MVMTAAGLTGTRVLLLPGWRNSGPDHWQSRWERLHGFERVDQDDWEWPRRGDWMARLDEVLLANNPGGPSPDVVLVAHSLGCQMVAAWAAHSRLCRRVAAAMLVAPADTDRGDLPPQLAIWRPIVRTRLPFASCVVASSDDPFASLERQRAMAEGWGASFVELGPCGHVNAESGLGDWPTGLTHLNDLLATAVRATPSTPSAAT